MSPATTEKKGKVLLAYSGGLGMFRLQFHLGFLSTNLDVSYSSSLPLLSLFCIGAAQQTPHASLRGLSMKVTKSFATWLTLDKAT